MFQGHGRKVGLSPGTPGTFGTPKTLGPPVPQDYIDPPEPPGPLDPRTPWDLKISEPLGNYLYRLKFRI